MASDPRPLAGLLLLLMTLASIGHGLMPAHVPQAVSAAAAWAGGLLLFHRVGPAQRLQVTAMTAVGALGLLWSELRGAPAPLAQALVANEAILAMLGGVTFLRLIAPPRRGEEAPLPRGRGALVRTLLGLHLFGGIVNASAVIIVGDRLTRRSPLGRLQATVLSRAFSSASFWSPFFAGMGVALTYAPGARLGAVAALGLPLAAVALALTALELSRDRDAAAFEGYPLQREALGLPAVLAAGVLALHAALPGLSVITLVAALSMALGLLALGLREGAQALPTLREHVVTTLPAMATELALFLSAGVLGVGIAAALGAAAVGLPFTQFGALEAWLLTAGMVGLAALGLHPVVGITLSAQLLEPLAPDPQLLALCFVVTWGLGVAVSPFSGLHLMLQGHYGVESHRFARWNLRYVAAMMLAVGLVLWLDTLLFPPGGTT